MALRQLYNLTTGTLNPSYLTNYKAGGAGSITTGTSTTPGISAPALETAQLEVLDVTAPTLINSNGTTPATPAPAGKLLVVDPVNGAFGAVWQLNKVKSQALSRGTFGIVVAPGTVSEAGNTTSSANGNISQGSKAVVVTEGPVQAYWTTTVNTTAISAGMALASDGAGNLTYAGASPTAGTVLGIALDNMAGSISTPALKNTYIGGF